MVPIQLADVMVVVTLCAVLCSWLAVRRQNTRRERAAVEAIERLRGSVDYDLFSNVVAVDLGECTRFTDAGLEHLQALNHVQRVYLYKTQVTDAGLNNIER